MGTWDAKNFGNDSALDWVFEFTDNPTAGFLNETIQSVFTDEYLESDTIANALAAIEVIAAAKGKPSTDFPEEIEAEDLQSLKIDQKLIDTCKKAIARITNEKDNELFSLWKNENLHEGWVSIQTELLERVS
jgi:hypothetical protein